MNSPKRDPKQLVTLTSNSHPFPHLKNDAENKFVWSDSDGVAKSDDKSSSLSSSSSSNPCKIPVTYSSASRPQDDALSMLSTSTLFPSSAISTGKRCVEDQYTIEHDAKLWRFVSVVPVNISSHENINVSANSNAVIVKIDLNSLCRNRHNRAVLVQILEPCNNQNAGHVGELNTDSPWIKSKVSSFKVINVNKILSSSSNGKLIDLESSLHNNTPASFKLKISNGCIVNNM
jgi:hypothetical protein